MAEAPHPSPRPRLTAGQRNRRLRLTLLLSVFALLLFALWYDYQIARPAVERTYDTVSAVNAQMNNSSISRMMTSADVQGVIGQSPKATFQEGLYNIEVYSWVAGLPFRSHDYYAVYMGKGKNKVFMRHYKYFLPVDELAPVPASPRPIQIVDASQMERDYERFLGYREDQDRERPPRPERPPVEEAGDDNLPTPPPSAAETESNQ